MIRRFAVVDVYADRPVPGFVEDVERTAVRGEAGEDGYGLCLRAGCAFRMPGRPDALVPLHSDGLCVVCSPALSAPGECPDCEWQAVDGDDLDEDD